LRLNVVSGNSWQGDIAIDALQISEGATDPSPTPTCSALDFNSFTITGFSNQDNAGDFSVVSNGSGLSLSNNTWKYIAMNYTVTANTVIEFDFSSSSQGEIHGIGFENDNTLTQTNYFKVHGSQNYGVTNFDDYAGGTKAYTIPVGSFYQGAMDRLVFINDNDAGSGNTSVFSNVKIFEGSCASSLKSAEITTNPVITAILGDEPEESFSKIAIFPNPATDVFRINLDAKASAATIYSILGNVAAKVSLKRGMNSISAKNLSLTSGLYLIKIENQGQDSVLQKLIIK